MNVEKIKAYLRRNHMTQSQLSLVFNCSRSKVANKLSNRDAFAPSECIALAQLLDIPRKDFINIFINDTSINDTETENE